MSVIPYVIAQPYAKEAKHEHDGGDEKHEKDLLKH